MGASESRTIRPERPVAVDFRTLIGTISRLSEVSGDAALTGLTIDSRDVRPGDLYVGVPGAHHHGASFLTEAISRGAVAFVTDARGADIAREEFQASFEALPHAVIERTREQLGNLAALVYGTSDSSALTFGVTGTNGKTSLVYILAAYLETLGLTVGVSTTAERRIGKTSLVSALTSPEAPELHALLARMREEHVNAVGVEVSAQAVARHRIDGVRFNVVAFTNFSQDHLDDFGNMERYFEAKSELFRPQHAECGVVVVDSQWGRRIVAEATIPVTTLATEYGAEADWHLAVTRETLDETAFVLSGPAGERFRAKVPLLGRFMATNAAVALIMLRQAGITEERIQAALAKQPLLNVTIPGRLECVSGPQGPRFYVDYGHTPGAFEAMLESLGQLVTGKIIMLFGADGDRDQSKRSDMGAIAARGADVVIVCDYNPRFESPDEIRQMLLAGARSAGGRARILEIPDPAEAIRAAIQQADEDDVILYAGPGHEEFREVAGAQIPFSARDEVRGALREAGYPA